MPLPISKRVSKKEEGLLFGFKLARHFLNFFWVKCFGSNITKPQIEYLYYLKGYLSIILFR